MARAAGGESDGGLVRHPASDPTARFYNWELRGRGWQVWGQHVRPEPPFRPFWGHFAGEVASRDDARQTNWASNLLDALLGRALDRQPMAEAGAEGVEPSPEPLLERAQSVEVGLAVPAGMTLDGEVAERLLLALGTARFPLGFEIVGTGSAVFPQIVARETDLAGVRSQLEAFVPDVALYEEQNHLEGLWRGAVGSSAVVEFGLAREFMLSLRTFRRLDPDPLLALYAVLGQLGEDEVAVAQILFEPARPAWAPSALRAVTDGEGGPFFLDAPEITKLAREKLSHPLFAAVVRCAAKAPSEERAWPILSAIAGALSQFATPEGNELVPLAAECDELTLEDDLLSRRTHRSGMLVSSAELAGLVHPPSASVRIAKLRRLLARTKAPPAETTASAGVLLGESVHRGETTLVRLAPSTRLRHLHAIGASGTGKSTLLVNLILQDLEQGAGVGVLDPHGDLIDEILGRIPEKRLDDVVLFDPADPDSVVGWNILAATSAVEREILASDLVGVFRRLSTSWGDQMTAVLANAIACFLESERGGTLLDLRRFLVEPAFRREFLGTVRDAHLRSFWETEFPLLAGKRPQAPILVRLDTLLRSRSVREVVTATARHLDFRKVVDDGKVFLGRLSQGAIGEENAALLGSLLVSKFHQVTLSRQEIPEEERRPFFLYLDEFHSLATPSMGSLFSGVRKYRLGLTVAHQDLYQLHATMPEVERAVLANAHVRVCFRVSDEDAKRLAPGFSFFEAADLTGLGVGDAICRVGGSQDDFNLRTLPLEPLDRETARDRRERVRARSRELWAEPRSTLAEPSLSATEEALEEERARPTVGEKAAPASVSPREPAPSVPATRVRPKPALPGQGGPEHTYLQSLITQWAQARGFRVELEKEVDGGRVDVALSGEGRKIAIEISVATGGEHEIGNVEKCLKAGYDPVILVSMKKRFLARLESVLTDRLAVEARLRVQVLTPEALAAWLAAEPIAEGVVAGYKVKTRYGAGTAGDEDVRRKRLAELVSRSLKRLKDERP